MKIITCIMTTLCLTVAVYCEVSQLANALLFSVVEAEKKKLAHYAKNFLPVFFTVYMVREDSNKKESDEGIRLSVLETLKCYLKVSSVDVRDSCSFLFFELLGFSIVGRGQSCNCNPVCPQVADSGMTSRYRGWLRNKWWESPGE